VSEQDEKGLPLGDASHLVDNVPKPATQVSVIPINLTGSSTGPDGEPQEAAQLGTAPAQLIQTLSGEEQIAAIKRQREPCPDCRWFHWPAPGSKEHAEVVAYVAALWSTLPEWQLKTLPGRNPAEWGICEGSPSGYRICAHFANSCEHFRKG
jgi:hypothetical protein